MDRLCDRPLWRSLDSDTSRFVVSYLGGLTIDGVVYEYGQEIPHGATTAEVLRRLYELPLRHIELLNFGFSREDPTLREACARNGVTLTPKQDVPVERKKSKRR